MPPIIITCGCTCRCGNGDHHVSTGYGMSAGWPVQYSAAPLNTTTVTPQAAAPQSFAQQSWAPPQPSTPYPSVAKAAAPVPTLDGTSFPDLSGIISFDALLDLGEAAATAVRNAEPIGEPGGSA
jgi:hypothetical protein